MTTNPNKGRPLDEIVNDLRALLLEFGDAIAHFDARNTGLIPRGQPSPCCETVHDALALGEVGANRLDDGRHPTDALDAISGDAPAKISISGFARELGLSRQALHQRLRRKGIPPGGGIPKELAASLRHEFAPDARELYLIGKTLHAKPCQYIRHETLIVHSLPPDEATRHADTVCKACLRRPFSPDVSQEGYWFVQMAGSVEYDGKATIALKGSDSESLFPVLPVQSEHLHRLQRRVEGSFVVVRGRFGVSSAGPFFELGASFLLGESGQELQLARIHPSSIEQPRSRLPWGSWPLSPSLSLKRQVNTRLPFKVLYPSRSMFLGIISQELKRHAGSDRFEIPMPPGGYLGEAVIEILGDSRCFGSSLPWADGRFPARIRAAAYSLHRAGLFGCWSVSHGAGSLRICRLLETGANSSAVPPPSALPRSSDLLRA